METADVVIVGGGIVGVTIAYHLARSGVDKVVLCERRSIGSGTSSMSGAMCGQQSEVTDTISRLAVRARNLYENFSEEIGGDCGFFQNGIMSLRDDQSAAEAAAAAARVNGSEARAITIDEARDIYPEIDGTGMKAATWYPTTGCVDAYKTMHSYVAGARRHGADVREFSPVTSIEVRAGKVRAVQTPAGDISPGRLVIACGPWSHKVAKSAGLQLPIEPTQVGVSFFRQPPDFFENPPVLTSELAIIPWHNKHFRVLRDTRKPLVKIDPDPTDAAPPQWMIDHTSEVIRRRLPKMRRGRFQGAYQTCYDDTPDLKPLLGFTPDVTNLFLDCGWSGRGFKFSVALGEYNAKWIMDGKTELDLTPWLATRFRLAAS